MLNGKVARYEGGTIGKIFGQKNITTYNLARMNMLLHGVKRHRVRDLPRRHVPGSTSGMAMRELNPAKKPGSDAIVANPPFSYRWDSTDAMAGRRALQSHGRPPKSAADFAFLLHGFHHRATKA